MKSTTILMKSFKLMMIALILSGSNLNATEVVLLSETFESGQGDFTAVQYNSSLPDGLNYVWWHDANYKQMKASAYVNSIKYATQSWLVSPELDFTNVTSAKLTFDHAARFFADASKELTVWVGTQEPYSSTLPNWQQVAVPFYPSGDNWTFVSSGEIDLSSMAGKKNVFVYFKYKSTENYAATWEIRNIRIVGDTSDTPEPPIGDVLLSETFESGQGDFNAVQYNSSLPDGLNYVWWHDANYKQMKASAFVNSIKYAARSWLVSPELDFTNIEYATLTFDHAARFFADASKELTVWVGTQEPYSSTLPDWQQVTVPFYPSGDNWTFVPSGEIDLSSMAGKKNVFIYFKYESTENYAATWAIRNVKVMNKKAGEKPNGKVEPSFMDFGEIAVGSSASQEIRITPPAETDDLIIKISPDNSVFTLSPLSNINGTGTLLATIKYTPTNIRVDEAKLTISGGGFANAVEVPLKGTGIESSSNVVLDETLLTENSFNKFYKESIAGDETWYFSNKYGAGMSGYDREDAEAYANEDWLTSPLMNLDGATKAVLSFEHAIGPTSMEIEKGCYSLLVASNYGGLENGHEVTSAAAWKELNISTYPDHTKWAYVTTEIEIPVEYLTDNFGFAFRYKSTDKKAAIWEIKNVKLTIERGSSIQSVPVSQSVYVLDNNIVVNTAQAVVIEVYDSMGQQIMIQSVAKGTNYIKGLQKGQMYIIKFANETHKVML